MSEPMSKMFDYIVRGGDKIAELEASLEHIGGVLGREIELNAELRAMLKRIITANADFRAGLPEMWGGDPLQDAIEAASLLLGQDL